MTRSLLKVSGWAMAPSPDPIVVKEPSPVELDITYPDISTIMKPAYRMQLARMSPEDREKEQDRILYEQFVKDNAEKKRAYIRSLSASRRPHERKTIRSKTARQHLEAKVLDMQNMREVREETKRTRSNPTIYNYRLPHPAETLLENME